jgi:hypothetical protein
VHADFMNALAEALLEPAAVGIVKRFVLQLQSLFVSPRNTLKNTKKLPRAKNF